jgi:hypothetical protein
LIGHTFRHTPFSVSVHEQDRGEDRTRVFFPFPQGSLLISSREASAKGEVHAVFSGCEENACRGNV